MREEEAAMRRWRSERIVLSVGLVAILVGLVLQAGAKEMSGTRTVEQSASGAPATVTMYDSTKQHLFRTIGTVLFVIGLVLLAIVFWRWTGRQARLARVGISRRQRRRRPRG
jgi:hypothetical protein